MNLRLKKTGIILCGVGLLAGCGTKINYPPLLDPIPDQHVEIGQRATFVAHATDPDGDAVTLSAKLLPHTATFAPATGTFDWQTASGDAGNHAVLVVARDAGSPKLADERLVNIDVHDPTADNHPPVWYGVPADGTATVGQAFMAVFQAVDPDGNTVHYQAQPLPTGATMTTDIKSNTGTLSWTPQAGDAGSYSMIVFAIDDGDPSMSVAMLYRITVSP